MGKNADLVRRFIAQVQIRGDRALCEKLVAPDFINHQIRAGRDRPDNRTEFCDGFQTMAEAFAPLEVQILDMAEAGDKVWTYKIVSGVQSASFHGKAPNGDAISFTVMDIIRIANGQIAEHWAVAVKTSDH